MPASATDLPLSAQGHEPPDPTSDFASPAPIDAQEAEEELMGFMVQRAHAEASVAKRIAEDESEPGKDYW